mmetsp:Transcript_16600/g.26309  ORF Transcript_16600/g.26309 Transcript_16600/m.26309 type:complete len:390 (-) Transcript_16600:245-1414(-)
MNQALLLCAKCGKTGELWTCGNCQSVAYCDDRCQRSHWHEHQEKCRKITFTRKKSSLSKTSTLKRWEMLKNGNRWQTLANPFSPCDVEVVRSSSNHGEGEGTGESRNGRVRSFRSCLARRSSARRTKKSVQWPEGLVSAQEKQIARICVLLKPEETVGEGLQRFHKESMMAERDELYNLAHGLAVKGLHYIYRTPRRLLEHLALESDRKEGLNPSSNHSRSSSWSIQDLGRKIENGTPAARVATGGIENGTRAAGTIRGREVKGRLAIKSKNPKGLRLTLTVSPCVDTKGSANSKARNELKVTRKRGRAGFRLDEKEEKECKTCKSGDVGACSVSERSAKKLRIAEEDDDSSDSTSTTNGDRGEPDCTADNAGGLFVMDVIPAYPLVEA